MVIVANWKEYMYSHSNLYEERNKTKQNKTSLLSKQNSVGLMLYTDSIGENTCNP